MPIPSTTGIPTIAPSDLGKTISTTNRQQVQILEKRGLAPVSGDTQRDQWFAASLTTTDVGVRTIDPTGKVSEWDGAGWVTYHLGNNWTPWTSTLKADGDAGNMSMGSGFTGGFYRDRGHAMDVLFTFQRASDTNVGGSGIYVWTLPHPTINPIPDAQFQVPGMRYFAQSMTWWGSIGGNYHAGVLRVNGIGTFKLFIDGYGDIRKTSGSDTINGVTGGGWQATDWAVASGTLMLP